MHGETVKNPLF